MTDVVKVDFQAKKKLTTEALPEHKRFVAAEDPSFKRFVEGLAQAVEFMELRGGNWKRLVALIHDPDIQPPGENDGLGTIIRIHDPSEFPEREQVEAAAIFVEQHSHLLDLEDLPPGVEVTDADPT